MWSSHGRREADGGVGGVFWPLESLWEKEEIGLQRREKGSRGFRWSVGGLLWWSWWWLWLEAGTAVERERR